MKTSFTTVFSKVKERKAESALFIGALIWGSLHAFYIYSLGLTTLSVDQNSHLNIARLVSDSLTPGISQLGFWPPLLHVLMAPFTAFTPLFESGLAGAFVLVPLLAIGAVTMYKLIHEFFDFTIPAVAGALLFLTNPYLLYYSATPMTETLFITSLLAVAYLLIRWIKTGGFGYLMLVGVMIAVTSLSRFEGFFLLPIVGLFIALKLFRDRKSYHEIEATTILFSLLALIGLGFVFIYGMAYGNGPFEFMSGQWAAQSQQESLYLPTVSDLGMSLLYMIEAAKFMIGTFMVELALLASLILFFLLRENGRFYSFLAVVAVLLSPFIFDIIALFQGSAVLYLDNLPPFNGFFNERYGLYTLSFAILAPMILLGLVMQKMKKDFFIPQQALGMLVVVVVVGANVVFLNQIAYEYKYPIQRASAISDLQRDQIALAEVLSTEYDGGKIFITRALQNYVTVEAGLPLSNYILESNHEFYEQALAAPWFYARHVVMYNPEITGIEDWRRESERISQAWANSPDFEATYELVYENESERLYRLNEDAVLAVAKYYDIDPELIPSLNTEIETWDQADYYAVLEESITAGARTRASLDKTVAIEN